ncbi:MAG: fumarylacetoacetate hydrolase family protein, partial [Planctomycetes bacterium]|nr:fumarylacetoacetate hydrolase family protein [Planctomycetota bacterium]
PRPPRGPAPRRPRAPGGGSRPGGRRPGPGAGGPPPAIPPYPPGNDAPPRQQRGRARDRHWPWLRSKNLATFGPFGPEWIPAAAMPPLASITLRGLVNGELRQEASLADLIWSPAAALAEISRWCPLVPGDLVFLGTPAGVAPIFPGDQLVVEAEGLGRLCNPVVAVQGSA